MCFNVYYDYRKFGSRALVLSLTLEHGNSKNECNKETEEEGKTKRVNMERSTVGT